MAPMVVESSGWPIVGRDAEIAHAERLFVAGRGGVVWAGPSGVGRSRLGLACLGPIEARGARSARVRGTASLRDVPLGAFAPLLRELGGDDLVIDGSSFRRLCRVVLGDPGAGRLALLVDDAHLLDGVSAGLVQQLLQSGAFVIGTIDTEQPVAGDVLAWWKEEDLDRIDLRGLGVEQIDALLSEVLEGQVDWATVKRLCAAADGSLLILKELVLATIERGALRREVGVWRLVGGLPTSRRLAELVQSRLGGLDEPQQRVVERLAFAESLALSEFADIPAAVLEGLERRSIIVMHRMGERIELRLAHPVYGQVLRDGTSALCARTILEQLADRLEATGTHDPDELLRIVTWRLESGEATPAGALEAARHAQRQWDLVLAERLARSAVASSPTFEARFLAAQLAAMQGRVADAEVELEALADSASGDRAQALVALARMDTVVFGLGQVDVGMELADEVELEINDPTWRDEIAGKRASLLAGIAGPGAAAELAEPIVERAQGRALVWGCLVSAYALGRLGRLHDARSAASRGAQAQRSLPEPLEALEWRTAFHDIEAVAQLDGFDEAADLARTRYQEAVEAGSIEGQAFMAWQLGMHAEDRGGSSNASRYGRVAVSLFRQLGRPQMEYFVRPHLAIALAIGGFHEQSREALAGLVELGLPASRYFAVDLMRAGAWSALASGDRTAAVRLFETGADTGREVCDRVAEASCLHALARLGGAPQVQARLRKLAQEIDGDLARLRADDVDALVANDPVALDDVAERFAGFGAALLAGSASASAALAWQSRGRPRQAAASRRAGAEHARGAGEPMSLARLGIDGAPGLTTAELRVAMHAIRGRSNREIAEELMVSIRTVQNQLQSAFGKLGISAREELAAALHVHEPGDREPKLASRRPAAI